MDAGLVEVQQLPEGSPEIMEIIIYLHPWWQIPFSVWGRVPIQLQPAALAFFGQANPGNAGPGKQAAFCQANLVFLFWCGLFLPSVLRTELNSSGMVGKHLLWATAPTNTSAPFLLNSNFSSFGNFIHEYRIYIISTPPSPSINSFHVPPLPPLVHDLFFNYIYT